MSKATELLSRLAVDSLADVSSTHIYTLAFLVLAVSPAVLTGSQVNLITTMLILGIFAMAYDFIYGYSGVVSFGHAAFFGGGTYVVAVTLTATEFSNLWAILVLSIVLTGLFALLISWVSIRAHGVFFAILTLAWAQVTYILVFNQNITGGSNGLSIDLPNFVLVPGLISFSPYDNVPYYYLVLVLLALSFLLLHRLTKSPFGAVLKGVRENPERMEHIGYNERHYRIAAFTISGAVSGLSGALFAISLSFAAPSNLFFIRSGEVIVWTIIGGAGTLVGPMIGVGIITYLEHLFADQFVWWNIPIGIIFILIVILMPEGLMGGLNRLREYLFSED